MRPRRLCELAARFLAAQAADDCRALCLDCHGYGSHAFSADVERCVNCDVGEAYGRGYCGEHICRGCSGKGVVCPHCHGMRFVREPLSVGARAVRCGACGEGATVSASKEMRVILTELARVEAASERSSE